MSTLREIVEKKINTDLHAHPSREDMLKIKRIEELLIVMAEEIDKLKFNNETIKKELIEYQILVIKDKVNKL